MKTYLHPGHSAEEQLVLLSAGTSSRRQAARVRAERLISLVDWTVLGELLSARRLMPTLGPRIVELAGDGVADEFAKALENTLADARRQGALLSLVGARVQSELTAAGIRCAPLKGPSLSEMIYGDPGRRLATDLDLLVGREQLAKAVSVVREMGYAAPDDHVDDRGLPSLHFAMAHERGELPPVELHWRIHCYEESFAEQCLLPPRGDLSGRWQAAPVDELVALLLFYARDGFMNLRLATDIGAWWDVFGMHLGHAALEEPMRVYPALERVLSAAGRVAEQTVGLPIREIAPGECRLNVRGRIAVRLADPHPRVSEPQLYANMGLIEGLLAPAGGLRAFVRRQVIVPRDVLQTYDHTASTSRSSSSPGHSVRVLGRYALAMLGLLRTHHSTPSG